MNAAARIPAFDAIAEGPNVLSEAVLAAAVETALAGEPVTAQPVLTELEKHAAVHRRAVATFEERRATAAREGRAALAALRAERKALREQFEADRRDIDRREAEAKAGTAEAVATATRLAEASRAALKAIGE